ncbi:MAG: SUMF1/EgtB/PvdO family nonheme iron enzyme [Chloroflexi bacterium]|nr:SUMF1/EgtB/PvdO family nonheme iron enzyme [Chloroflexota bacterium]
MSRSLKKRPMPQRDYSDASFVQRVEGKLSRLIQQLEQEMAESKNLEDIKQTAYWIGRLRILLDDMLDPQPRHTSALPPGRRSDLPPLEARSPSGDQFEVGGSISAASVVGDGQVKVAGDVAGHNHNTIHQGGIYIDSVGQLVFNGERVDVTQRISVLEREYLQGLLHHARRLPLGQLETQAGPGYNAAIFDVTLESVFVPLDITAKRVRGDESPSMAQVPLLDQIMRRQRLMVLGDPGSGKSSMLNYLTIILAGARLYPDVGLLKRLSVEGRDGIQSREWTEPLLPVVIQVRELAGSIPVEAEHGSSELVWAYIVDYLKAHDLGDYAQELRRMLRGGGCLVMFDGLDEVALTEQRRVIREAIDDFTLEYERTKFLATCRVLSYTDNEWRLSTYHPVTLAPLNRQAQIAFIDNWFSTLARLNYDDPRRTAALSGSLRAASEELPKMSGNPMLLTLMAVVHTGRGELPHQRARLYQLCVQSLLFQWQRQQRNLPSNPILDQISDRQELLITGLSEIAFQAHQDQGREQGEAYIGQPMVIDRLARALNDDYGLAKQVCDYIEERAGLLLGKGSNARGERQFAFPHRGFQEFLAARHIVADRHYARRVHQLAEEGDHWHETLLLTVGHWVYNHGDLLRPLDAINLLVRQHSPTNEVGWRCVRLAAEMLMMVGKSNAEHDHEVGAEVVPRLIDQLATLVDAGKLAPAERASAADVLGQLGDPRRGVCSSTPDMLPIEGGVLSFGGHRVRVAPFKLARYPITNAQFRRFMEDGYHNDRFWTAAGIAWRLKARQRGGSVDYPGFGTANRPVVGLSWFEALAFTRWMAYATGQPYRLPTEVEWQCAAGGLENRKYPWGERTPTHACNERDTGIGQTVAVGIFPRDRTPEGVADLGGNIWEWTSSRALAYPYRADDGRESDEGNAARIARGGSYNSERSDLQCAVRHAVDPVAQVPMIGFRLALGR